MDVLTNNPIALSDCGQYFSYCTLDGQLKIWDTLSGRLKQEYTPSSHLSATGVSISWPQRNEICVDRSSQGSPKKKRKRKTSTEDISQEVFDLELLALGTINGSILLYSVVKNDLYSQLKGGHEDRVNDMSWLTTNDSIFSCSNDKQVIEWSISTARVKKKWSLTDNKIITAIYAIDSTNILIAGNSIKWLDWEKKTVLMHFSGHGSEVNRLKHVKLPDNEEVLGSYFLSSGIGDRLINGWQLKTDKKRKTTNSLASFSLDEEPICLDITPTVAKQPILISVVTKSGLMYVFEHILNGHRKTPINPKVKIQIITETDSKKVTPKQLNIFSAQISSDRNILLIYGSLINPVFERISYEKCVKNTVLTRKDPTIASKPSLMIDSGFTKIKTPLKPKNATVVGPAGMAPTRQTVTSNSIENKQTMNDRNEVKDKKGSKPKNETLISFEERLRTSEQNHEESVPTASSTQQPSSDSLTHVLVQGLQSRDQQMLETVFSTKDESVIRNTLKKLPIDCISMFLNELQNCLFNKSDNTLIYIKWLEQLLNLRLTFLMTLPNVEQELAPLIELINARTHILDRIFRLKGRLNLLFSQIRTQNTTIGITREKPSLNYESSSESSEDEDIIDDKFKDLIDDSDEDMLSEDGKEDHQTSDESIDGDNYMSEDIDDNFDLSKINDIETD